MSYTADPRVLFAAERMATHFDCIDGIWFRRGAIWLVSAREFRQVAKNLDPSVIPPGSCCDATAICQIALGQPTVSCAVEGT